MGLFKNIILYFFHNCFYAKIVGITTNNAMFFSSGPGTSNVCQSSNDCPPNAYCEYNSDPLDTGQCVCNPGFIIVAEHKKRECYPVAKNLGDSCTHDDQCQMAFSTESECFQGTCDCKLGTHFVRRENTCYKSVSKFINFRSMLIH